MANNNEQLQQELEELRGQIEEVENKVNKLEEQPLSFPLDHNSQEVIRRTYKRLLPADIFEILWENFLVYETFFESLSGFNTTTSAGGSISLSGSCLEMETDTASGNTARFTKTPSKQGILTFATKSRFKTTYEIHDVTNQQSYIVVGDVTGTGSYYGFKGVDNALKGVTYDGSSENVVDLNTQLNDSVSQRIEARYIPNKGVTFFVNDKEAGESGSNLPDPSVTANQYLLSFQVKTNDSFKKILRLSHFFYMQRKFHTD